MKKWFSIIGIISIIIIIGTIIIFNTHKSFHIYEVTCTPGLNYTCNEKIEIENMIINNITITKNNLNNEFLSDLCNQLNKYTWGCGKYLVLYE